ncbi:MAG: hypothetical protein KIT79_07615 [Deltaproteobacteria bacterium]|nr:hypothetical protein [Deltaproteobacteria bacterium]
MAEFNISRKEITFKLVYYGPALSGKTTNLQVIHKAASSRSRGELMKLDTEGDRTLFFDLLPMEIGTGAGFKVKLKLFTVPGQVQHNTTRRAVLKGTDAVAFIADSQKELEKENASSYLNLKENLKELGMSLEDMPFAIQFNKRDLPNAVPSELIQKTWGQTGIPVFMASAIEGKGVIPTLDALVRRLFQSLEARYEFSRKYGLTEEEFMSAVRSNFRRPSGEVTK